MKKIINKIYDSFYPLLTLEERNKIWCDSLGKHTSYGADMTHEKFDELGIKKRVLTIKNKKHAK